MQAGVSDNPAAQSTVHGVHGSLLPEATLLPNSAILAPASETRARVGTRLGSAIALDLRHLAGSSLGVAASTTLE